MSVLGTRVLLGVVMFAVFFGVVAIDAIFHTDIGFGCMAALAGLWGCVNFMLSPKERLFSVLLYRYWHRVVVVCRLFVDT